MTKENKEQSFALCIENKECEDLEKRKIYTVLPDDRAAKEGYLRIVDEGRTICILSPTSSLSNYLAKRKTLCK